MSTATHVLLINPKMCSPSAVRMPLSLLALGAVLEGRHPYTLVDGNVEVDWMARALAILEERPDSLVGITYTSIASLAPRSIGCSPTSCTSTKNRTVPLRSSLPP